MSDHDIVILSAVRTAQGKFQGGFSGTPAQDLGAIVMKEALSRAGVKGEQLDEVIFGNVIQAGLGQNTARQAELKAGIPQDVPAVTVNRVCVSSATALAMAASAIKAGDGEVYLVGGTENMSRAPWLLQNGRTGYRMGLPSDKIFDSMVLDGLWCAIGGTHMGLTAENLSEQFGISREQQDEVAYRSHINAVAAIDGGRFKDEIVPVEVPQRKGPPVPFDTDEVPRRDTSLEALARLKPAFQPDGIVTAGNAPGITDGAAATVVMSRAKAEELGLQPLARIVAYDQAAVEPLKLFTAPIFAVRKLLKKTGTSVADYDLFEVNEAFASQTVADGRELGLPWEKVNVNGGAIALGHPIGCSGTRIAVTLIYALRQHGLRRGLATLCLGGGEAVAMAVELEQ